MPRRMQTGLFAAVTASLVIGGAALAQAPLKIVYTAKTLGYYRHPDEQTLADRTCPSDGPAAGTVTRQFLDAVAKDGPDGLILGMGDNFAPQLKARTFAPAGASTLRKGKDVYTWDFVQSHNWWPLSQRLPAGLASALSAGQGRIPMDNVGCFFRLAHYTALVPGKHDFYFGPERLRELAYFLSSPANGKYQPVKMLAANLSMITTSPRAEQRLPRGEKNRHLKYDPDLGDIATDMPGTVLPFLPAITVTEKQGGRRALNDILQAELCSGPRTYGVGAGADPDEFLAPGMCTVLPASKEGRGQYLLPPLIQDTNYGFCITFAVPLDRSRPRSCQPFTVHAPFFSYGHYAGPALWGPLAPPYELPWATATVNRQNVTVFGIVDPDLLQGVGNLNYSFWNGQERWDTTVEVIEPESALWQALQKCQQDQVCQLSRKVLMAQMPPARAQQLVTHLAEKLKLASIFDAVIAQADLERATGDWEVSKTVLPADPHTRRALQDPTFLLVPGPLYNPASSSTQQQGWFSIATITPPHSGSGAGRWTMVNATRQPGLQLPSPPAAAPRLGHLVFTALAALGARPAAIPWSDGQLRSAMRDLALLAMRKTHRADVALLQKRDLFEDMLNVNPTVSGNNLQEVLDEILWKGDFVVRLPVTGATLKALMSKSKEFDAADKDSLSTALEQDRGIVSLGIFQDSETKNWIVNGQVLEDAKLYALAITDYLALGDTGYSALQTPAIPPADRVRSLKSMYRLGAVICNEIRTHGLPGAVCDDLNLEASNYFDPADQAPFDTTPGYTPWRRFLAWARPEQLADDRYKGQSPVEGTIQQRRVFSVSLEQFQVSQQINVHGYATEKEISQRFAAVPIAAVTAPNSVTWNVNSRFRAKWSGEHLEWYLLDEVAMNRARSRKSSGSYQVSLPQNLHADEGGLLTRLYPQGKQSANLKWLTSIRWQSQFVDPVTVFSLRDQTFLQSSTRRSQLIVSKHGLRFDNAKSWFEGGFEIGRSLRVPVAFRFTPDNFVCYANAGTTRGPDGKPSTDPTNETLADCVSIHSDTSDTANLHITKASTFTAIPRSRWEKGWFLNFHLNVPLPIPVHKRWALPASSWAYVIDNRGEYFWNRQGDTSVDTKYLNQSTHSLVIPIWGNLSIVPKVDFFFYQNKAANSYIRTLQTSVALQYCFDWHTGLPWRALLYRNPSGSCASR